MERHSCTASLTYFRQVFPKVRNQVFAITVPFVTDEMVFPSNEDVRGNYFKILGQKKKINFFSFIIYLDNIF